MLVDVSKLTIFYGQEKWDKLLGSEKIQIYISPSKGNAKKFFLDFSSRQGQNITLGFRSENISQSKELIYELKKFLAANPSKPPVVKKICTGFFMDFPNNSVFRGATTNDANGAKLLEPEVYFKIKETVTQLVIRKLAKEEIDEDSVFSFLFSLQVRLTEILFPVFRDAQEKIRSLVNILSNRIKISAQVNVDKKVATIFDDNIKEFNTVSCLMWRQPKPKEDAWLLEWEQTCKEIINDDDRSESFFLKVSTLIFEQLNIVDNYKLLLSIKLLYALLLRNSRSRE